MTTIAAFVRDFAALCLSVLAFGVSVWSVMSARRTASRQNELQERLLALETSREQARIRETRSAQIRAGIVKAGSGNYRLVVRNEGPSMARNVKVLLDDAPALQHRLVLRNQQEISKLGPDAGTHYSLAVTMGSQRTVDVRITWDDDTGEARSWESELTVV